MGAVVRVTSFELGLLYRPLSVALLGISMSRSNIPSRNKVFYSHRLSMLIPTYKNSSIPCSRPDRQTYLRTLPNTLTRALQTMLLHTSSEAGRAAVPPITNSNLSPFPMKITVKVGSTEVG